MPDLARTLISVGALILLAGIILLFWGKFFNLGRLPGDIFIQKGNFSFYFPLTTSVVLSIILSVILFLCLKK
ncbi:MAG: DUF2905 domain-containing protein [Candidatus Omnitrophica bacterium]|nr:DUF2905 domain-containing protein [Candidatus Omnitrophota bacterium]